MSNTNPQLFLWQIYPSITIKSNQFGGKKYNKHSQVLLYLEKILENEITGEVPR